MAERTCVYTALFGKYEDLLEQPVAGESDIDFICFTDDETLVSDSWELRVIDRVILADPARSSRYPKILPHRVLSEYDVSVYIDNSVLLKRQPEEVIEELLPPDEIFATVAHSFRETVLDEFRAVIESGFDAEWVCDEQLEHYRQWYPEILSLTPLMGGVLVRRHMHPDVVRAMELWWYNVLRYSRRDQLSFRIALAEAELKPTIWNFDFQKNDLWEWPVDTGRDRSLGSELPTIRQIQLLEKEVANRDRSITELKTEAAQLSASLAEGNQELERVSLLQLEAEQGSVGLVAENAASHQRLEDVFASNSWRITSGARKIGELVRRYDPRR